MSTTMTMTMSKVLTFLFLSLCIPFLFLLKPIDSSPQPKFPCNPPNNKHPFCDTSLPVEKRAKSIVKLLTLDEKIHQLSDNASDISRLGIPSYQWWSESLHGIAINGPGVDFSGTIKSATAFPQVIGTSAAFNRTLWRDVAAAIAVEARAMHNHGQAGLTFWAPNINIFRDPRWGRGQETSGEDPMLTSAYAFEYVTGFQGQDRRVKKEGNDKHGNRRFLKDDEELSGDLMLSACCKHYTAYDLEGWGGYTRYDFNAEVSKQDMADTFEPPFQTCAQKAKASCVMCSYNRVNGLPSCANRDRLEKTRKEWGFKGYIVSDCGAVADIYETHNFTKTPEEAVAVALNAGTDIDCGSYMKRYMKAAFDQGMVSEKVIDRALFHLFSILIRLGLFDGTPANGQYANLGPHDVCTSQHRALAYDAAIQGMVLLKNDHKFLPWKMNEVSSLAIIGPLANASNVNGDYTGFACKPDTILQGFQKNVKNTSYASGCQDVACNSPDGIAEAVSIAREAEYVVLVMGLDLTQENEDHDRHSLLLPGYQETVIKSVAVVAKKPLVLVLANGGPVDVSFAKENPQIASIIWIGYPGETGGEALSDILFGRYNPGGRLPMTWYPESFTKVPMTNMRMRADSCAGYPGRTYKFYTGESVYKFGDGLSYTDFSYKIISAPTALSLSGNLKAESQRNALQQGGNAVGFLDIGVLATCESLKFEVEISVTNKGHLDGSQVVLLYSQPPNSLVGAPKKQLIGFDRVHTLAGKSAKTSIAVDACEHLSFANEEGLRILPLGNHTLIAEGIKHTLTVEV